jgi:hypothetical protein
LSDNPRPPVKISSVRRANPDTEFYIDFDWWEESNLDLKTYLLTRLSLSDESSLDTEFDSVDLVDPQTGEVRTVDGFQYLVQTYFHQMPDDFITQASLVDAAFSVLLANANKPMSAEEIAARIERPVDVVVRTLGGTRVYQGIRPVIEE